MSGKGVPKTSAEIIATALQTDFGQEMFGGIQTTMGQIVRAGRNRDKLIELFEEGLSRLDPSCEWRKEMEDKTEVSLTRLGNLRSRSFQVKAEDRLGILRDILQHLLIKPATRRVAGRSPAIGFILLFVAGLKANSCKYTSASRN